MIKNISNLFRPQRFIPSELRKFGKFSRALHSAFLALLREQRHNFFYLKIHFRQFFVLFFSKMRKLLHNPRLFLHISPLFSWSVQLSTIHLHYVREKHYQEHDFYFHGCIKTVTKINAYLFIDVTSRFFSQIFNVTHIFFHWNFSSHF